MTAIRVLLRQQRAVQERASELGLSAQSDIQVVAEVDNAFDLLMAVRQHRVDAVVTGDTSRDRALAGHLFAEFPDVTLLRLGVDGGAVFEQRCARSWSLAVEQQTRIVDTLRFAVRHPCGLRDATATSD